MISEADNIYQQGWNDCMEFVIEDMERDIESTETKSTKARRKN